MNHQLTNPQNSHEVSCAEPFQADCIFQRCCVNGIPSRVLSLAGDLDTLGLWSLPLNLGRPGTGKAASQTVIQLPPIFLGTFPWNQSEIVQRGAGYSWEGRKEADGGDAVIEV